MQPEFELAKHQKIALQAMGIDVYQRYQEKKARAALVNKPWFGDLLEFLGINEQDCQFSDTLPISFDPINKLLVLPFTVELDDASLKKQIWQHIKDNIEG